MEMRRKFAEYPVRLLKEFFQDEDELFVAEYAQRALSKVATGHVEFIWKNFMEDNYLEDVSLSLYLLFTYLT